MAYLTLANSSFLDYCGFGISNAASVEAAYKITDGKKFDGTTTYGFNVGLMLNRQQDPTTLLAGNWASRQRALAALNDKGTLWDVYGADIKEYDKVKKDLKDKNLKVRTTTDSNYVIGVEPRMIWVSINTADDFKKLFDTELLYSEAQELAYWNGNLSLPEAWADQLSGIWIDNGNDVPPPSNLAPGVMVTLPQGGQSIGSTSTNLTKLYPQALAALYRFPLQAQLLQTGAVGLIEPGIGTYLQDDPQGGQLFLDRLSTYLQTIGQTQLPGGGGVFVQGPDGQTSEQINSSNERSLDVGVVAAVNPNSLLALYNGSGETPKGTAAASVFTAAQSAIWDTVNNPAVTSNSYGDSQSMAPGSPFYTAYWQMFLDAALRNQTTVIALGDGGSGNETGNGVTNVETNVTQPYNLLVGGTSLSNIGAAASDATLTTDSKGAPSLYARALNRDPAILWQLMRSGLSQMPDAAAPDQWLLESVWNTYVVDGNTIKGLSTNTFYTGYLVNSTSSGGVDPTQPTPSYQSDFGLAPVTTDPLRQSGRGAPDVAINAGGNTMFLVPQPDMTGLHSEDGTSAAAPLYASLLTQINFIFQDQGLPNLGYANDLLYTAAVVTPGAFNDVTVGNNISSYSQPGPYTTTTGNSKPPLEAQVQPTGYGYAAGPGYDLVSGLGSPNGTLLARALTAIAHSQMASDNQPALLQSNGLGALTSSTDQTLLWQVTSPVETSVTVGTGSQFTQIGGQASAAYAWTSQLAQQSLMADFDPALVRLFDGAAQGSLLQTTAAAQDGVVVSVEGSTAGTPQLQLSNPYGFADFVTGVASVRASRPVSVATTPGDVDNVQAVVRMRQNGFDALGLFFYRVDDLTGQIDGLQPGQVGYDQAVLARRYAFSDGSHSLLGAGYGKYSMGLLNGVNSGDLIAFGLNNNTHGQTFYGFAQANEIAQGAAANYICNYGFNTYGFEDTWGGGDLDFNDAIFQLDFSSASGNQYLL